MLATTFFSSSFLSITLGFSTPFSAIDSYGLATGAGGAGVGAAGGGGGVSGLGGALMPLQVWAFFSSCFLTSSTMHWDGMGGYKIEKYQHLI